MSISYGAFDTDPIGVLGPFHSENGNDQGMIFLVLLQLKL